MDQIVEVISSDSDIGENNEETRTVISGSSREISLREFIEIYEILPELWDPEDPLYRSKKKKKRNSVLDKVVIVFNKIKPNATHNDVRKKINILRSNYRKELKEILASKKLGKCYFLDHHTRVNRQNHRFELFKGFFLL